MNVDVSLSSYIKLFLTSSDLISIPSTIEIEPKTLGCNIDNIILIYGEPDYIFNDNKLKIFVYSRRLNTLKIRYEIHFYNNKVFLVNNVYRQLSIEDKNYLIISTIGKYITQDLNTIGIFDSKITDDNNDSVFISNFLCGLKITYLSIRNCIALAV
jgi:hypothetical protein